VEFASVEDLQLILSTLAPGEGPVLPKALQEDADGDQED